MSSSKLHTIIQSFFQTEPFLTHADIAKKLKKDKAKVSGYLEAMVDYGELEVKKAGNSKLYFLKKEENTNFK